LKCFLELRLQIGQPIKHPDKGPQLNELSNEDQKIWRQVIKGDLARLKILKLAAWEGKLGPEF
jgi:hypothetical protein